jgi:hypothetical protein
MIVGSVLAGSGEVGCGARDGVFEPRADSERGGRVGAGVDPEVHTRHVGEGAGVT